MPSSSSKNFIGLEGFIWWIGVVEDREDPEQLGRVRVRCFGWHTDDKNYIPTDGLPWAHPVMPVNAPNAYTPKEGDMVFGFFVDGANAQNPAVLGVLPGKPAEKPKAGKGFSDPGTNLSGRPRKPDDSADKYPKSKYLKEPTLTRLSRGKSDGTVIATRKKNLKKNVKSAGGVTWSEPSPPFKPKYPYNNALETESGHALEFDDTPGAERVHLAHRMGAYMEFDKDGSKLERVQKDNYCVVMGDDFIFIKGKASITVEGNFNLRTSTINIEAKAINMASDGDIKIKGKNVNIEATGAMNLKAASAGKFTAGGRLDLKGATAGLGGATVDIPAAKVNLQSGSVSAASGAGITGGGSTPSAEEKAESANATTQTANTAASANAVAAGTATGEGGLEEVKVTGKRVEGNTAGATTGKKDTLTSTISNVAKTIGSAADGIVKDFAAKLPIGEIAGKVEAFGNSVNDAKTDILSLQTGKTDLLSKIDKVSSLAYDNSVDFKLDKSIQNDILKDVYKVTPAALTQQVAKRLYPLTETITVGSNQVSADNQAVLARFAAQTEDGGNA